MHFLSPKSPKTADFWKFLKIAVFALKAKVGPFAEARSTTATCHSNRLFAIGYWLLAIGYWLLATGY
jgi:hypothetical protein